MKKIVLLGMALLVMRSPAQQRSSSHEGGDYNLLVSGGLHLGLWTLILNKTIMAAEDLPFNIQVDKVFRNNFALGLGYSYDRYQGSPIAMRSKGSKSEKQNLCVRLYKFIGNPESRFITYIGTALGVSYWTAGGNGAPEGMQQYWPTAQFLFGMKLKLSESTFWQTEFGAGPPYFCQTSLGIKF